MKNKSVIGHHKLQFAIADQKLHSFTIKFGEPIDLKSDIDKLMAIELIRQAANSITEIP